MLIIPDIINPDNTNNVMNNFFALLILNLLSIISGILIPAYLFSNSPPAKQTPGGLLFICHLQYVLGNFPLQSEPGQQGVPFKIHASPFSMQLAARTMLLSPATKSFAAHD